MGRRGDSWAGVGGLTLTLTEPSIFHSSPSRADSKEDFPAPTGPTTASRQPCGTVRSTLWAKRGHESWSGPSPFLCSEPHAPQPSPGVDLEGRRQLRAAEASPSCAQSSGHNSGCHPAHICAHTLSLTPVHAYRIYERRQELLHIRPHTGAHHAHGPVGRHTADGGVKPSPASPLPLAPGVVSSALPLPVSPSSPFTQWPRGPPVRTQDRSRSGHFLGKTTLLPVLPCGSRSKLTC